MGPSSNGQYSVRDNASLFGSPMISLSSLPVDKPPHFQTATSHWSPIALPIALRFQPHRVLSSPSPSTTLSSSVHPEEKPSLASQLYSASCSGDLQLINILVFRGTPINVSVRVLGLYGNFMPAKHGHLSPLAGAATYGRLEAALILISNGAQINPHIGQSSSSPLHQACRVNDLRMTRLLFDAGAHIDRQDTHNATPIMYAVRHGSLLLIELVLSHSPDLDLCFMVGISVIYWALLPRRDESVSIVAMLLGAGADANMRMADGGTPLHYAALGGLADVVEVLLRFDADASLQNKDWKTPLDLARIAGSEDCVTMLDNARLKPPVGVVPVTIHRTRNIL